MRDKSISAGLCTKNAGGTYVRGGGFAGHYSISTVRRDTLSGTL